MKGDLADEKVAEADEYSEEPKRAKKTGKKGPVKQPLSQQLDELLPAQQKDKKRGEEGEADDDLFMRRKNTINQEFIAGLVEEIF